MNKKRVKPQKCIAEREKIAQSQFQLFLVKPARSAGFSRIKKIRYQAPPTQLGPRKCTF